MLQFRLDRIDEQQPYIAAAEPVPDVAYATSVVTGRIRDTQLSREVKSLYNHTCQVCATQTLGLGGRPHSEGAHVRPLGMPHLGADSASNILCLCPNHHVELDLGGSIIMDDYSVVNSTTRITFAQLTFKRAHRIDIDNIRYHRAFWSSKSPIASA